MQRQELLRATLTLCKVYDWNGKGILAQAASMRIMEYCGAFDDEQFAVLLESWEGLGLTKESVGSFYVWPLEQSQVPCTRE